MSYILTALKKSEAERAKGAVPRLTTQQVSASRARGVAWPWIIGAALLANAAVVVLAWGPEVPLLTGGGPAEPGVPVVAHPPAPPAADAVTAAAPAAPANGVDSARPVAPAPPSPVQRAPAEQKPPGAQARRSEGQPARPPATPALSAGQESRIDAAAARDVDPDDDTTPPPSEPAPRVAAAAPAPASQPPPRATPLSVAPNRAAAPRPKRKPAEALAPARPGSGPGDPLPLGGRPQVPAATGPELALVAPEPAPLEPVPEVPAEPDPYASVPMLWQLPSVIRSTLPKLSMSVHVYSPEAPGRFIIVDRKKYREGDVLKGGVRLEAILADGIVLDYQGRRYRIGN